MSEAKDIGFRQKLVSERISGASYRQLSSRYGINKNTVMTICNRYKEKGESGLVPFYDRCGHNRSEHAEKAFRLVRLIKYLHPQWGVPYILERLRTKFPEFVLQSERQYQRRLFLSSGKLPKAILPKPDRIDKAKCSHDVWQIDAKERLPLGDGTEACYLNITDEKTSAVLAAKSFPPGEDLYGAIRANP